MPSGKEMRWAPLDALKSAPTQFAFYLYIPIIHKEYLLSISYLYVKVC